MTEYNYCMSDDTNTKRPIQLTSRDQSILASLCEVVGGIVRDAESGDKTDATKAVDRILEVAWTFEAHSVEFGKLYEKLHRTGANE